MKNKVISGLKYVEDNVVLLSISLFLQVFVYATLGNFLLSTYGTDTVSNHPAIAASIIAFSMSIRFNIPYFKDMIRKRSPMPIQYSILTGTSLFGRTTKIRFFGFVVAGSALSILEYAIPTGIFPAFSYINTDDEFTFLFRWVTILMMANILSTLIGKYISMNNNVKNKSIFSLSVFITLFIMISTVFFIESDAARLVLVVCLAYLAALITRIHDKITDDYGRILNRVKTF